MTLAVVYVKKLHEGAHSRPPASHSTERERETAQFSLTQLAHGLDTLVVCLHTSQVWIQLMTSICVLGSQSTQQLLSHGWFVFQGSENICRLSLIINRAAAQVQKDKMDLDCKSGPVSVPSALDMTDSDDEL